MSVRSIEGGAGKDRAPAEDSECQWPEDWVRLDGGSDGR